MISPKETTKKKVKIAFLKVTLKKHKKQKILALSWT